MTTWIAPKYGVRARETNFINQTIAAHDNFCGCDTPIKHLLNATITRGGIFGLTDSENNLLRKCLGGTETDGTDGTTEENQDSLGPEGDILEGELQKLFEEDGPFTEEDIG